MTSIQTLCFFMSAFFLGLAIGVEGTFQISPLQAIAPEASFAGNVRKFSLFFLIDGTLLGLFGLLSYFQ